MLATFHVTYTYIKKGTNIKTSAFSNGSLKTKSELLVMQYLQNKHKDCDIVIREIKWV